jgi:ABC-type oligopeptide transport system ATPase subunit
VVTQRTLKKLLYAATVSLVNQIPKKAKQNKMKKQKGDERRETRSFSYRKMSRNMHVKCQRKEGMIEVKVQARQKNKHDSHIERHLRFIKGLAIIT